MKRLFFIRHIRWLWLHWRLSRFIERCRRRGIGIFAQPSDIEYLQQVWKGKA